MSRSKGHDALRALAVLHGDPTDAFTGDDQLHDARRAVANLQAHHIAHALLVRQTHSLQ
jgi:hypothetical protein